MDDKAQAFAFLVSLENWFRTRLCGPEEMRLRIPEIRNAATFDSTKKHWGNNPEAAFLNALITPLLFEHMQTVPGISSHEARQSLVSDYWHSMPEYCSQSSARTKSHPFSKRLGGESSAEIMARWRGQNGKILKQPYPDFAFRKPFPYKILFEGKYFAGGNAERALVEAIYETCFYLGLPVVPEAPPKPAWDYSFGCLIAYDASLDGSFKAAWDSVIPKVEFWESANVYVMVLGGQSNEPARLVSISQPIPQTSDDDNAETNIGVQPHSDLVTVRIAGARETANSIITPPLGGLERWFDKRRGISCVPHPDGGLAVTLPISELEKRGLQFLVPSVAQKKVID